MNIHIRNTSKVCSSSQLEHTFNYLQSSETYTIRCEAASSQTIVDNPKRLSTPYTHTRTRCTYQTHTLDQWHSTLHSPSQPHNLAQRYTTRPPTECRSSHRRQQLSQIMTTVPKLVEKKHKSYCPNMDELRAPAIKSIVSCRWLHLKRSVGECLSTVVNS